MLASELAEATGISEAMVSRLASGDREPSLATMEKIGPVLVWAVHRQVDAVRLGNYASEFKERMEKRRARPA